MSAPAPVDARRARVLRLRVVALVVALLLGLGGNTLYRAGLGRKERTDLPVYLAAAERVRAGEDPLGAESSRGWGYFYPPTLATLLLPLAGLPLPVAAAVWFAVGAAALIAGACAARRAVTRAPLDRWDAVAAATVALPAASALLRGQLGPALLGLCGGALLALRRGRDGSAGVLLALAAALKVAPAAPALAWVVARRWRACAAFAAALVAWLVLVPAPRLGLEGAVRAAARAGGLIAGLAADPSHVRVEGDAPRDPHLPTNQALASQVIRRVPAGAARTALLLLLAAGTVGAGLVAARQGREADAFALLLAAPLLAAPVAWHHHHVVLLPALLLLADRARGGDGRARVALGACAALALAHFALSRRDAWGLLGLGTLVAFAALAAPPGRRDGADAGARAGGRVLASRA